jgi:maltose alpha-D-glucosyltransferase/alpha-amylase
VLYYGDEIGMGDNPFLGDRDGVRTPMQWSADRNAGFSRADTVAMYLPPIIDPLFGHEAVNVEQQQQVRSSLLNWMRWMIRVRNAHQAFGRGDITFLRPENDRLLVFTRTYGDQIILCICNLAETTQAGALELSSYVGRIPFDLFGACALPAIGDGPYLVMLPGHSFYWLKLVTADEARLGSEALEVGQRPELPDAHRPPPRRITGKSSSDSTRMREPARG